MYLLDISEANIITSYVHIHHDYTVYTLCTVTNLTRDH